MDLLSFSKTHQKKGRKKERKKKEKKRKHRTQPVTTTVARARPPRQPRLRTCAPNNNY